MKSREMRSMRAPVLLITASLLAAPSAKAGPRAVCTQTQLERAHRAIARSLFEVSGAHGRGLGALLYDAQHIVTSAALVRAGRGFEVRSLGGQKRRATIVAVDSKNDIALLRLTRPVSAEPLRSVGFLRAGSPVLGYALRGGDQLRLVAGSLGKRHRLRSLPRRNFVQGPVFDCEGAVVGLRKGSVSASLTPVYKADRLAQRARLKADSAVPAKAWRSGWRAGPMLSVMTQLTSQESWFGPSLGLGLIDDDRLFLPIRLTVLALSPPRAPARYIRGLRVQGSVGLGYRWLMISGTIPVYVVPNFAIAAAYDWRNEVLLNGVRTPTLESLRVSPAFGLSINLSLIELSYQVHVNVEDPDASIHQFGIGAQFL